MNPHALHLLQRAQRSRWILPLAVVAALLVFGINELAYRHSTQSLNTLRERGSARAQIQKVWRSLVLAESNQRGYLLTGRRDHLPAYQRAVGEANEALATLAMHYRLDAEVAPVLGQVTRATEGKLSELATTIELHDADGSSAAGWRELLLTDIGREQMDDLREASRTLLAIETRRVADDRADIQASLRNGRHGVIAMSALSLLALLLFLRQTFAFGRAQRDHAAAMQAERERLEGEVGRRTADLTGLARHLQNAREDERSRLARELHDELGALLTAAKLDAARLKRVIGTPTTETATLLKHLNDSINRGIEFKRHIIEVLRPSSLGTLGLAAALEILLREHGQRTGLVVRSALDAVTLPGTAQITVYRLVQEALANVQRHADATEATVTLQPQVRHGVPGVVVEVRDNGRGFDPDLRRGTTHGLMGLRYRVEAEGGLLDIVARPGDGACLSAWLPSQGPPAETDPADTAATADTPAPATAQAVSAVPHG